MPRRNRSRISWTPQKRNLTYKSRANRTPRIPVHSRKRRTRRTRRTRRKRLGGNAVELALIDCFGYIAEDTDDTDNTDMFLDIEEELEEFQDGDVLVPGSKEFLEHRGYSDLEYLGIGSTATVYKATNNKVFGKQVAIKAVNNRRLRICMKTSIDQETKIGEATKGFPHVVSLIAPPLDYDLKKFTDFTTNLPSKILKDMN